MTPEKIIKRLHQNGFEAHVVGGYVRDLILGIKSSDVDIATNARYNHLEHLFKDCKIDVVGKTFQVMMIDGIEVATYRQDIYDDDGTHTHSIPVKTIEEDLGRRDLTINSMASTLLGHQLIDPYNGRYDIKHRIIRFTGDAHMRIIEDPVRMLRACRFLALIDRSRFEVGTFQAIEEYAHLIKEVPPERIRIEIVKAMKAKNAGNFFRALANTGLLKYVFPNMMETIGLDGGRFHNETVFEHCALACDNIVSKNPALKIAAFLHDIGKPLAHKLNSNGSFRHHDRLGMSMAETDLRRLKFSTIEINYIISIIGMHMINLTLESTEKSIRRMLVKLKKNSIRYRAFVQMVIADHDANLKNEPHNPGMFDSLVLKIENVKENINAFSIKDLEISGNDVMEILNIKPGKKVGEVLKKIFEYVIDNPTLNERATLLNLLKDVIK